MTRALITGLAVRAQREEVSNHLTKERAPATSRKCAQTRVIL